MLKLDISPNLEYLITLPGFGKLLTVVFGAVVVGLGSYAQEEHLDLWREKLFIGVVLFCFIVSFFYSLFCCFSYQLVCSKINKIIDITYHAIAGVMQMVVGAFMLDSAVRLKNAECKYVTTEDCHHFEQKIGAGIFAIVGSIVYFGTAVAIYKVKNL